MKNQKPSANHSIRQLQRQTQITKRLNRMNSNLPYTNTYNSSKLIGKGNRVNIKCAFHSEEQITNFCKSKQCLLPLCPKCVGIHIQEHSKMGVFGAFVTIDESFSEAQENLKYLISQIDDVDQLTINLKSEFESRITQVKATIQVARVRMEEMIRTMFDHYEAAVGYFQNAKNSSYLNQIDSFQQYSNSLFQNGNQCLKMLFSPQNMIEGIIGYYSYEEQFNSLGRIRTSLQSNKPEQLILEYKVDPFLDIETLFKNYITVNENKEAIWSEFKALNKKYKSRGNNLDEVKSQISKHPQKIYNGQDYKPNKDHPNLTNNFETFISPFDNFSLAHSRHLKNLFYQP